jgi:acyl carrier protein
MAEANTISHDQISQVFPKVAATVAGALARDVNEVTLTSRLIGDLDAESIDLLDIVFRLERAFKIKIPRNKIVKDARGDLSEAEFEHKGTLTELGRRRLQQYMSEIPPESFPQTMKIADVPRLFTVETFCKVVLRGLAEQNKSP